MIKNTYFLFLMTLCLCVNLAPDFKYSEELLPEHHTPVLSLVGNPILNQRNKLVLHDAISKKISSQEIFKIIHPLDVVFAYYYVSSPGTREDEMQKAGIDRENAAKLVKYIRKYVMTPANFNELTLEALTYIYFANAGFGSCSLTPTIPIRYWSRNGGYLQTIRSGKTQCLQCFKPNQHMISEVDSQFTELVSTVNAQKSDNGFIIVPIGEWNFHDLLLNNSIIIVYRVTDQVRIIRSSKQELNVYELENGIWKKVLSQRYRGGVHRVIEDDLDQGRVMHIYGMMLERE